MWQQRVEIENQAGPFIHDYAKKKYFFNFHLFSLKFGCNKISTQKNTWCLCISLSSNLLYAGIIKIYITEFNSYDSHVL